MPRPGRPARPARPRRPGRPHRPAPTGRRSRGGPGPARIVVLGDLMLDVVLAPARDARVRAPTCRDAWRSSRAARRPTRPAGSAGSGRGRRSSRRSVATRPGRALVEAVRSDGVTARVVARRRRADRPDRGRWSRPAASAASSPTAARRTCSTPADLRAAWFAGADAAPPAGLLAPRRAARAGRPARRSSWRAPPVPRSASTSPRSGRCWRTAGARRAR